MALIANLRAILLQKMPRRFELKHQSDVILENDWREAGNRVLRHGHPPRPASESSELGYVAPALVNDAVKIALAENAEDLAAFDERKREPNLDFEQFAKALERRGRL